MCWGEKQNDRPKAISNSQVCSHLTDTQPRFPPATTGEITHVCKLAKGRVRREALQLQSARAVNGLPRASRQPTLPLAALLFLKTNTLQELHGSKDESNRLEGNQEKLGRVGALLFQNETWPLCVPRDMSLHSGHPVADAPLTLQKDPVPCIVHTQRPEMPGLQAPCWKHVSFLSRHEPRKQRSRSQQQPPEITYLLIGVNRKKCS